MIGKLLEKTIRTATLPVDVAERTIDVLSGGDGSRKSQIRGQRDGINWLSSIRDATADACREIDDDRNP